MRFSFAIAVLLSGFGDKSVHGSGNAGRRSVVRNAPSSAHGTHSKSGGQAGEVAPETSLPRDVERRLSACVKGEAFALTFSDDESVGEAAEGVAQLCSAYALLGRFLYEYRYDHSRVSEIRDLTPMVVRRLGPAEAFSRRMREPGAVLPDLVEDARRLGFYDQIMDIQARGLEAVLADRDKVFTYAFDGVDEVEAATVVGAEREALRRCMRVDDASDLALADSYKNMYLGARERALRCAAKVVAGDRWIGLVRFEVESLFELTEAQQDAVFHLAHAAILDFRPEVAIAQTVVSLKRRFAAESAALDQAGQRVLIEQLIQPLRAYPRYSDMEPIVQGWLADPSSLLNNTH